ncbi:hypothetical protein BHWA1_02371 [Brachyspira hyodysenteriae WA1]|uniref:Uncharacterized protein n=1 Tax=Brachyspira hyodysenteriae (strain ATCC 49526 / WA1) TaxID=565034 RepID=A0A3B6VAC8_BRAHW|nr:hypothetical protein BHWA1_02371 [Brachyspira hyodysenteriae WA1]
MDFNIIQIKIMSIGYKIFLLFFTQIISNANKKELFKAPLI